MPPMPMPVTNRNANSAGTVYECAAPNMPSAMATRHPRIIGRRPILSATPPSTTEPMAMPSNSVDSTQPRVALSTPQSLAIPGAAKLIDRTSKPSMALRPTVTITTAHCQTRMAPSSMIDLGSVAI